jgi:hypothetical protein
MAELLMTKDQTKDPEFQKVVQTFLQTPPQPHKPSGKGKPKTARSLASIP